MPFYSNTGKLMIDMAPDPRDESGAFNEFTKGVSSGVDQLQGLIGGGGQALVGSLFGNDEMFYDGMAYYNEQMAEAAENQADVGRIEDIDGFGDLVNYSAFIVGNVIPSLIGGGGVGALGGVVAKQALKKGINAKAQQYAKDVVKDNALKVARKQAGDAYAKTALGSVANKGRIAGAVGFGTAAGAGESFTRILEETGEEAAGLALVTGVASGALDAMAPLRLLNRILPPNLYSKATKEISEKIAANPSRITRALREAGKQAGIEGVTEMTQEIIQNVSLEYVREMNDPELEASFMDRLFDENRRSAYINAAVAGAIGGFSIGGVSGALSQDPTGGTSASDKVLGVGRKDSILNEQEEAPDASPESSDSETTSEQDLAKARRRKQLDAVGIPTESPQGELDVGGVRDPEILGRRQKEAKDNAQGLPEKRGENVDPQARILEAREGARARLDNLPNARGIAKSILESQSDLYFTYENESVAVPAKPAVAEEAPTFGGNLPDPSQVSPPMESLVGKDIDYQGIKGVLTRKDDGFYVVAQEGDVFIESGDFASPEQLGVTVLTGDVQFTNDVSIDPQTKKFNLREKEFTLTSIKRDRQGKAKSLSVRDAKGKLKTIREPEVVGRIAMQMENPQGLTNAEVPEGRQSSGEEYQYHRFEGQLSDPAKPFTDQLVELSVAASSPEAIDPSNLDVIVEAIDNDDVSRIFDRNDSLKVQTQDKPLGKSLPTVEEAYGDDAESVTDVVAGVMADLSGAGVPKSFIDSVTGLYVHQESEVDAPALTGNSSLGISLNADLIEAAQNDPSQLSELAWSLTHEVYHAADFSMGLSNSDSRFGITIDESTATPSVQMGDVMGELFQNWADGTELGKRFDYPFNELRSEISDLDKDNTGLNDRYRQEAFAQLGAMFHSNPELLQEQAPLAYNFIKNIRDSNLRQSVPQEIQNEISGSPVQADTSQPTGISGQIRAPPVTRSVESAPVDDTGSDGEGSAGAGRADPTMERSSQDETGERERSDVQEPEVEVPTDDGVLSDPETVKLLEDERVAEERMIAEDAEFDSFDFDDTSFIKRENLSPAAQEITASGVLYGNESIDVVATGRNGSPVVVDLARAFDDRVKKANDGEIFSSQNEATLETISDLIAHEAVEAMNTDGNAGEWYQEKVANAMRIASETFPELATEPNSKFAFTAIMAITSNGASVPENSVNTFEIYEKYRETKIFPDFGVGKESQAMEKAFSLLNRLTEAQGVDSVREFMDIDITVKELVNNFGLTVSGELMGTRLKGSAILGPKIGGGFYQNLNGNFDPLTMDRWFMRTYGRLTGTLMAEADRKLPAQVDKFREVALGDDYRKKLKDDGISRSQLKKDDQYLVEYATKVQSSYANGGFKLKNSINKASNNLKNSQGEKQAPQNGKEREFIREVMTKALTKVNETSGMNSVNMGALQAIVWYPEKNLYKMLGVGNKKSEPTDYETEFQKITEARGQRGQDLSGSVGSAQQSGAGRLESADGADVSNTNPAPSRQNRQEDPQSELATRPEQTSQIRSRSKAETTPNLTPEEANAAQNARIREEKSFVDSATSWASRTFRRNLAPQGLLNDEVFESKIKRDGEIGAVEIDIRMYIASYDEAIKNAYPEGTEVPESVLNDALQVPVEQLEAFDLPKEVKDVVGRMRRYIDKYSADYSEVIQSQLDALDSETQTKEIEAKQSLLSTFKSNLGKYLNRSYRAFDDPNWAKSVPDNVLNNAKEYLAKNGATNVERVINTILKEGTAFDGIGSFIVNSKLGAKDLSILKKKNNTIAPEILALLGEYKEPRINFVKTATKLSRLVFNHKFLEDVKAKGEGAFLFTEETAPSDAYVKLAADQSDVMSPLNGFYVTPELKQGFEEANGLDSLTGVYQNLIALNSIVKYGKTVIAPTTIARNFMSAGFFTVANGHFDWSKTQKSLEVARSYFNSKEGDATAYLRELKRWGVVYDTPIAGELIKAMEDSGIDALQNELVGSEMAKGKLGKAKSKLQVWASGAAKFYQYGDDFWKIVGFQNEMDMLMEAKGLSYEDAAPIAAERIRNTYPTYSLIGRAMQQLRRFPLAGTFVSFPAEIIRTSFNMFKYLKQDMADPDMRPSVHRRLAGMALVSGGIYAIQAAAFAAWDVSEEEEEAIRLMSPEWSRNSNIVVTGRDEKGDLEYIDLTYLDPYAYWKRPINALLRDQPVDDALVQSAQEMLTPFFGKDISAGTVFNLMVNEKDSGGRIYNPADTATNITADMGGFLFKNLAPSVFQNISRTMKAVNGEVSKSGKKYEVGDEALAWVGFRTTTFDPKVSLHFKAYEFNQDKRDATSILTSTFRDPNDVSNGDLINAFERASGARKEGFERMIKLVSAARSSGLNDTQLMMVLRSNGVTKKDARSLVKGDYEAWAMSDSTLKNTIKKSDLLFGKAKGKEFEDRWKLIQELLSREM